MQLAPCFNRGSESGRRDVVRRRGLVRVPARVTRNAKCALGVGEATGRGCWAVDLLWSPLRVGSRGGVWWELLAPRRCSVRWRVSPGAVLLCPAWVGAVGAPRAVRCAAQLRRPVAAHISCERGRSVLAWCIPAHVSNNNEPRGGGGGGGARARIGGEPAPPPGDTLLLLLRRGHAEPLRQASSSCCGVCARSSCCSTRHDAARPLRLAALNSCGARHCHTAPLRPAVLTSCGSRHMAAAATRPSNPRCSSRVAHGGLRGDGAHDDGAQHDAVGAHDAVRHEVVQVGHQLVAGDACSVAGERRDGAAGGGGGGGLACKTTCTHVRHPRTEIRGELGHLELQVQGGGPRGTMGASCNLVPILHGLPDPAHLGLVVRHVEVPADIVDLHRRAQQLVAHCASA
jgi:hypothetical protein